MEGLAQRTAAEEARFFRAEDDLALRRRMERLVANAGATTTTTTTTTTTATSALSDFDKEVLAHRKVSLQSPSAAHHVRSTNPLKVSIDVAGHSKRVKHHSTFVDYLKVPQVSMGRAKWEVHGDASVFSVKDGKRLATTLPDPVTPANATKIERVALARQNVVEMHAVDSSTVKGIRLYPKLNAGRAFLWGSVLAVWGSAVLIIGCRKALKIDTVEDLDGFVNRSLAKPVAGLQANLETKFQKQQEYKQLKENDFFRGLKNKFL